MAISQKSIKQSSIALSTVEVEYIALSTMVTEVLQLWSLLQEAGFALNAATIIHTNNNGVIITANNSIISPWTKHIDIRHHFIKHHIESNTIALRYCKSARNTADVFTKALPYPRFTECRVEMGVDVTEHRKSNHSILGMH